MVEGHGTTIDVVLVNGVLHEGDQIVVCGMQVSIFKTFSNLVKCADFVFYVMYHCLLRSVYIVIVIILRILHVIDINVYSGLKGPIVTSIRALLTPHPMKELRVKVIFSIKN